MNIVKCKRSELALNQFETAIILFLSQKDYISVITLAGAADVIFSQLITRRGVDNFTDMVLKDLGVSKSKQQIGKEINDMFYINHMKHLDPGDEEFIEMNAYENAYGAIIKGLVNYKMLAGHTSLLENFLKWIKENLDPELYNIYCDPNWKAKNTEKP